MLSQYPTLEIPLIIFRTKAVLLFLTDLESAQTRVVFLVICRKFYHTEVT